MNCIYQKFRSKNYTRYLYCTIKKEKIEYDSCKNCKNKEFKKVKPMKQKTSKLNKLEKSRISVFTDNLDKCIECSKSKDHLHEIYYGRNRQKSMLYNFVIPLCEECHRKIHKSPEMALKWKIEGQLKFELSSSRDEFISIFGKSYLFK